MLENSKVISSLIPPLISSSFKTFNSTPPHPQWPKTYELTVNLIRETVQRLSKIAPRAPKKILLTKGSFVIREEAIESIRRICPAEWINCEELERIDYEVIAHPSAQKQKVILFIHGGAFVTGSAALYQRMNLKISELTGWKVFGPDYRLAPQHPFPCALIDAVSAYMHLLEKYSSNNIVLMGDSAGGGLVLSLLLLIKEMGLEMPLAGYCLSPWCDLTHSLPSFEANELTDYLPHSIKDTRLVDRKHYYTSNSYLDNQFVSPLFATTLNNLPPLLIQCGSVERLYDEIEMFSRFAARDGVMVQLEVYEAHVHVFQMFPFIQASEVAWTRAAAWITNLEQINCFKNSITTDSIITDSITADSITKANGSIMTKGGDTEISSACIYQLNFNGVVVSKSKFEEA